MKHIHFDVETDPLLLPAGAIPLSRPYQARQLFSAVVPAVIVFWLPVPADFG